MAAGHVRGNAPLVHRFKTHKLSRLLIRFIRCFIVTNYSSCACLFTESHNLQTFVICLVLVFIRTQGDYPSQLRSFCHVARPEAVITSGNIYPSCAGPHTKTQYQTL